MAIQPERSGPIVAYARAPDNVGKSRRQLARELGVHESLVRRSLATITQEESMPKPKEEALPVALIVQDPEIQPRASSDEKAVGDYRKAYEKGRDLGLVVVFRDLDENIVRVADGFHRLRAAGLAGLKTIRCEVRIGNRSACIAYALNANLRHTGIRYTRADKRRAIGIALADPELSKRSDRELAELCGVDHKSVGKFRKESTGEIPQLSEPEKRVGKDGKARSMPTRQPEPTAAKPVQDTAKTPGDEAGDEDDPTQLDGKGGAVEDDDLNSGPGAPTSPQIAEPTAANIVVSRVGGDGPAEDQPPEPTEADLPDDKWLETLPARAGLTDPCREKFDKDAICYRHGKKFMDEYRRNMRPLLQKARVNGDYTADANQQVNFFKRTSPKDWIVCPTCKGTGSCPPIVVRCCDCNASGYKRRRDYW